MGIGSRQVQRDKYGSLLCGYFVVFFLHKFILMCWFGESGSQAWVIYLNTHLPGKSLRGEQKK